MYAIRSYYAQGEVDGDLPVAADPRRQVTEVAAGDEADQSQRGAAELQFHRHHLVELRFALGGEEADEVLDRAVEGLDQGDAVERGLAQAEELAHQKGVEGQAEVV